MNYLAHARLSFDKTEILVGNLISDFVKGNRQFSFSPVIQQGIRLHRAIDGYTDRHEATREAKMVFKPVYHLYASAFVDVVYDHFLANDPNEFTDDSLLAFSRDTYTRLEPYLPVCPPAFANMFPFMKQHNWLYHYQYRWGIERSFGGLARRAAYITESETAFRLFEESYDRLSACYEAFFPDIKKFAARTLDETQALS
jgi:acyl carrier protein phosphodiesterase